MTVVVREGAVRVAMQPPSVLAVVARRLEVHATAALGS
jgi:hypothetical protein